MDLYDSALSFVYRSTRDSILIGADVVSVTPAGTLNLQGLLSRIKALEASV